MNDAVLFGLCLWCVGATWLGASAYIKTIKLKILLVNMAEVIKDIHEGKATIIEEDGGIRIRRKREV